MDRRDLEAAWDVDAPPPGFAERVVAHATESSARSRSETGSRPGWLGRRGRPLAVAISLVVAVAAGLAIHLGTFAVPRGSAVAADRTTRSIDGSAVAVLEPHARIEWLGRVVTQSAGDVFYRVEPGRGAFRIETPAGSIEVLGTCFRVQVHAGQKEEGNMDAKKWGATLALGGAGATLGSATTVTVYEGRTRLQHEQSSVVLQAGQAGALDGRGARRIDGEAKSVLASLRAAQAESGLAGPLGSSQLAALEREKKDLEAQLRVLEGELVKQGPKRNRNDFDLDQADWRALAAKGRVKFRIPCLKGDPADSFEFSGADRERLGLSPEDGEAVARAYRRSNERLWSVLRPLCVQAVGKAEIADTLGGMPCLDVIRTVAKKQDPKAAAEAFQLVADVRAGLRPAPEPGQPLHPVFAEMMAVTGEMPKFEADLAETFGPEEAKRIAWGPGCQNALTLDEGTNRPPKD